MNIAFGAAAHHIVFDSGSSPFGLDFALPRKLEASEPPEARGLRRDQVKLMISHVEDDTVAHTTFEHLPNHLAPGDVLVINTSETMSAALPAVRSDGTRRELHLSTRLPSGLWTVELRCPRQRGSTPFFSGLAGERWRLPEGGSVTLLVPHAGGPASRMFAGETGKSISPDGGEPGVRLWIARLEIPSPVVEYLNRNGSPIRYDYVDLPWPIEYYRTVYGTEPGSAEMPSAGRAFTPEIITRLVARGIRFAPLLLHTGVASPELHEPPYEEFYRVPSETASLITTARAEGHRIIGVGTTTVRALESVTDEKGNIRGGEGWTDLLITRERGLRTIDGLLTGLHEPRATHLAMLGALADRNHLQRAYNEALRCGYLWHEFGDLHLLLSGRAGATAQRNGTTYR